MKKKLLTALSFVMVAVLSIAGTIAYLTSEDQDVNVMTMGNVKIEQLEYERVVDENGKWISTGEVDQYGYTPDKMQEFTQEKSLLPKVGDTAWDDRNGSQAASGEGSHQQSWGQVGAPGSNQLFDDSVKNVQDKFVFVKNTGKTAAYYRTIIAIESPEGAEGLIGINKNGNSRFDWDQTQDGVQQKAVFSEPVMIAGTRYVLATVTYTEALTPGEVSRPSLLQVYMKSDATNEQAALFGDTVDILVYSQAVQTAGFDSAQQALEEAFNGPITETNHPWVGVTQNWIDFAVTSWYDEDETEFTLSSANELAGLAKLVKSGETFNKKTITLDADINLIGKEWTPIGNSTNKFQGTFDGHGHTVSNLLITGNSSNVGLFGYTTNGEIKNITVDDAQVSGYLNVGVVAGSPYTSKYTNVTVTGDVKVDGFAYVGAVGGKNAYTDWSDITVNVSEGSYVNADSVDGDVAYRTYVGGVVGFMGEGGHTMSNVTSNIDVIGSTCDVGGIVGIAHYGNNFVNCSSSGNVTITKAEDAGDAEQIGGIAGVWHNGGQAVTFEGCSYTGKLTVNVDGVDLTNNTIVGAAYNASGNGELIIK